MTDTLSLILNAAIGLITGLAGFFVGYKKNQKEADGVGIQNVEKALDIYKQMLDDMKKRYDAEIENMKSKLASYEAHIAKLETTIKELKKTK
jgi:archaellum component FlaC